MKPLFKEQDDKAIYPFDLGYMCGETGGDEHNPYDEDTDACTEFSDGYHDATMNWSDEEYSA